jgi:multidrug efflux pump subunit AcrB
VQVDLNRGKLLEYGLSASDVGNALAGQNIVLPAGDQKIGPVDYMVQTNASPLAIDMFNNLPVKRVGNAMIYNQIVVPTLVSTLCISIVWLPLFQLGGVAGYLFLPMAEAIVFAMIASFILSRTLVPTLAAYLLRGQVEASRHPNARKLDLARAQSQLASTEALQSANQASRTLLEQHRGPGRRQSEYVLHSGGEAGHDR